MSAPRPNEIVFLAGGDALARLGVFVQRTSPAEDVPETHTRTLAAVYRDRTGTMNLAGADVPRPEMLDLDGDGVYETPSLLLGSDDLFSAEFLIRPTRAGTLYVHYEERGVGGGIVHVGSAAGTGARLQLTDTAGVINATHNNGTSSVSSALSEQANLGDKVELLVTFAATGAVQVSRRANGGTITAASASGVLAPATAWSAELLYINSLGSATAGTRAYIAVKWALGTFTMDEMADATAGSARAVRLYPASSGGVWGWTTVQGEAGGIVERMNGVLGADSALTSGGATVWDIGGEIVAIPTHAAPSVTISGPTSGSTIYDVDGTTLTGTATDTEDGSLTASIAWASDLDGALGTGGSVSVASLSVGTHKITATATDSGYAVAQAYITITVLQFLPSLLSNLAVWTKADAGLYQDSGGVTPAVANNDPVGLWQDQSGNGKDVSQGTSGNKPTLKTNIFGSRPGILFTTDDYLIRTSGISGVFGGTDAPLSVLVAIKQTSLTGTLHTAWILSNNGSGSKFILLWTTATPLFQISREDDVGAGKSATAGTPTTATALMTFTSPGTTGTLRRNGVALFTAQDLDVGASTYNQLALGTRIRGGGVGDQFFEGYIAEVLAFTREITPTEVTRLEKYLALRWGVTL